LCTWRTTNVLIILWYPHKPIMEVSTHLDTHRTFTRKPPPHTLLSRLFAVAVVLIPVTRRVKGYTRYVDYLCNRQKKAIPQRKFVDSCCHAHSNVDKPPKTVTPTLLGHFTIFFSFYSPVLSIDIPEKLWNFAFPFPLVE